MALRGKMSSQARISITGVCFPLLLLFEIKRFLSRKPVLSLAFASYARPAKKFPLGSAFLFAFLASLEIHRVCASYNNKQVLMNKEDRKYWHWASNLQSQHRQSMKSPSCQASLHLLSTEPPSYDEESSNSLLFTGSDDQSSEQDQSVVSLEEKIMEQHFRWLNHSILKTCNSLLWMAFLSGNYSAFDSHQIQHEDSLVDYLGKYKSLIPRTMIAGFLQFLAQVPNLQDLLEWMYGHVQAKFGDELILIAFRVVMAYLPIKRIVQTSQQIRSIPLLPFNLANIYNDPSLRILHFSSFYAEINGFAWLDMNLYRFCVAYMETILLVLQQYFQNPYYKQIQEQEKGRRDGSNNRSWKKKKKIAKRK